MKTTRVALVDCNNFYVSCERLFRPCLRDRPVVVLSNNDGCVIARSNEAKELGIPMGEPYFKVKDVLRRHGVQVFSSNYALYGDLSCRVMAILQQEEPEVELYSIDESFVRLCPQHGTSMVERSQELQNKISRCVGIPVSIGVGSTKTRAKIATLIAKKYPGYGGVFDLEACSDPDAVLASIRADKIWGIGRSSAAKLARHGIRTALDLKNSDRDSIRKLLGLTGLKTMAELCGEPCITLEQCPPARKSIVSSRSFRRPVTALNDLREAIACYISIGARKLRDQNLVAANLHVFLATSKHRTDTPRFSGSLVLSVGEATASTPHLIAIGGHLLERLYRPGYQYNKAGIMLTGLSPASMRQQHLFLPAVGKRSKPVMQALDHINNRWGRDTVRYAASGLARGWSMKQQWKSPAYTTRWNELPVVR